MESEYCMPIDAASNSAITSMGKLALALIALSIALPVIYVEFSGALSIEKKSETACLPANTPLSTTEEGCKDRGDFVNPDRR